MSAEFKKVIESVTREINGRAVDKHLEAHLNRILPPSSPRVQQVFAACQSAINEGWMCQRVAGGIRYGRVLKPSAELAGFSVDVVQMQNVVGSHHSHPNGEVDLVMPVDADAEFDGHKAGWVVYEPNSAHKPTVTGGRARILYLLPAGAIDFKAPAP